MVQHTTVKPYDLKKKWLYNRATAKSFVKTPDGDIIKSGNDVNNLRKSFPDAKFLLILSTNRILPQGTNKDDSLYDKVLKKCKEFGIDCDVWEQSRISDYLDNNSEGHWLRKQYLGIDAELLSGDLLKEICYTNLDRYKDEFSINDDFFLPRQLDSLADNEIKKPTHILHFLLGESGFGKSIISFKLLKKHLDDGNYGLWIPASFFKELEPLDTIIGKTLKNIYPSIEENSGKNVWNLSEEKGKFLIVVDDVNRVNDPETIVRKLISLISQFDPQTRRGQSANPPFTIICPIWPKLWVQFSQELKNKRHINIIEIDKYSIDEAETIIIEGFNKAGYPITKINANQFATKLGCDPFLIHSFLETLRDIDPSHIDNLAIDAIEQFIESKINDCAKKSPNSYFPHEYVQMLEKLCYNMLEKKQFLPSFSKIEDWLKEDSKFIKLFRELVQEKTLCRLDDQKTLVFRHDRIRFHLLTHSMLQILEKNSNINYVISDPYYAEILGQSLLLKVQSISRLTEIQKYNILALFEALKLFGDPKTNYQKNIVELIFASNEEILKNQVRFPALLDAICWQLVYTDSADVVKISEHLSKFRLIQFARIRNGCAKSGIDFCSNFNHFEPSSNYPFRDRIFEHAIEKHSKQIQDDLKIILKSPQTTEKDRYGALIFIGLLRLPNLRKEILICWENSQDKKTILPAAIWAGLNCCEEDTYDILNPIFEYWAKMPNVREAGNLSELERISDELRLALMIKRRLSNSVVKFLILQSKKHESFDWAIKNLLYVIDDPDAIEFVIANSSEFFGISFMRDVWDYKRQSYGQKLSPISLNRLESIWKNDEKNEKCRKNAFQLWKTGVELDDFVKLQNILPDSPLFMNAVLLRAELKDFSVVPEYLKLISQNPRFLYFAHHLWYEEIQRCVEKYLESCKDSIPKDFKGGCQDNHYELSRLLMAIPLGDAEKLLLKYWDALGFSRLFIHTALYIGTPESLRLAEIAISKCPPEIDIFEHISHLFWFTDYNGGQNNLTIVRLNNLKPYLNRFSKKSAESLAHLCNSCGFTDWGRIHLSGFLSSEDMKQLYPSDDDIIEFFKEVAKQKDGLSQIQWIWLEKFEKDMVSKERLFKILEKMLANDPSFESFQIASVCVKMKGNRKDLELLNKYDIQGSKDEIFDIKKDVQFQVFRRTLE